MRAFKLTEEMESAGFSGGTVRCSALGHAFDVFKALEEGAGIIATDDSMLAEVLREYPALEEIVRDLVPKDAKAVKVPGSEALASSGLPPMPVIGQLPPVIKPVVVSPDFVIDNGPPPDFDDDDDPNAGAGVKTDTPPPSKVDVPSPGDTGPKSPFGPPSTSK